MVLSISFLETRESVESLVLKEIKSHQQHPKKWAGISRILKLDIYF